ncbi:MAG: hypothetical protein K2L48_03560 [Mycoplasmoidaceae bacterium]|nr:hypothetical protein [Mycoplasmoidaceae bacterium]
MKISRKTIGALSCGMSIILIGSGALVGVSLIKQSKDNQPSEKKPLNRGDNYEHYKISQLIQKNSDLKNIITTYIKDNKYTREISENKFIENISKIIKDVLSNISKFKSSIDKYKFDLSYRINPEKTSILIDVVWYIPNNFTQYYYYDQFSVVLSRE